MVTYRSTIPDVIIYVFGFNYVKVFLQVPLCTTKYFLNLSIAKLNIRTNLRNSDFSSFFMNTNSKLLISKYNNYLKNHQCKVIEDDYNRFELNRRLLVKIAEVENSSLTVYDMHKKNYIFLRSKFDQAIGYDFNSELGSDFFLKFMHPDDLPIVLDAILKTFNFLDNLPPSEKTDYKLILDFRLRNRAGAYFLFVQQVVILELDNNGEIWLVLKLIDLISERASNEVSHRKLLNIKTGKLHLFNDDRESPSSKILTNRETEILGLISQGLDSKNISERLFISVNTVNNHRQNILSKTKSGNISQAMLYAKGIGIL